MPVHPDHILVKLEGQDHESKFKVTGTIAKQEQAQSAVSAW